MTRQDRREDDPSADALVAAERIGHARCEAEVAQRELDALRRQQDRLTRDLAAVRAENTALEQELLRELASWRGLDAHAQRLEEALPRVRQVTGSLTYRLADTVLRALNRLRRTLAPRRG